MLDAVFPIPVEKNFHSLVSVVCFDHRRFILLPKGIIPALLGKLILTTAIAFRLIAYKKLRNV